MKMLRQWYCSVGRRVAGSVALAHRIIVRPRRSRGRAEDAYGAYSDAASRPCVGLDFFREGEIRPRIGKPLIDSGLPRFGQTRGDL
jgi:hypothetical protein